MKESRLEQELPLATEEWGWKYHHLGVPTDKVMPNERYLPQFKLYTSGFSTCPFGVEWMRFEADSPIDKLIQTIPHLVFAVDDLDYELATRDFNVITYSNAPIRC